MSETMDEQEARDSGVRKRVGGGRVVDVVVALVGIVLALAVATVPMAPRQQAVFAVGTAIAFLVANRFSGKPVTLFLVALSLSVSLRYIFWRFTETLVFGNPFELLLGSGLVLGYVQTVWPLERKPMPLPADPAAWPNVDVYIPTYNEPMTIVRATVLAAMEMDWPSEKLRVWLLDDGRREEFRQFAEEIGCGYITRNTNQHAKAGNLNHALSQTDGEYVAIFDCDHIPTRAFLQMTLGWLVAESNMALVQTPHHFYSPDPFQRNLAAGTRVPSEGNMFYGLVQDGNDYWNAAFFCGSCAVLRREALADIGGFAVETVTEDAHTALKLHRRGWDSAYLKIPLAGGLATERLALHIGQRIRWARGMIQILRIDNPLFGPGLTFGQRVCYLQATGHFLFALPRIVFLTSPLAFLLLSQNVISASPLAITAYAVPHIFHSVATNSRLQRNWRHSFWSEIYETVMALFLVRVTLQTLATPRRGKFNVTAKGGLLENGFFDLRAVYPNLILAFLLVAGVVRGIVTMVFFTSSTDTLVFQALLLNSIWATLSLLIVLAALAVGRETRQIRSRARINASLPVRIYLADGRSVTGTTRDLSQGGASVVIPRPDSLDDGADVEVGFIVGGDQVLVPGRALRWDAQMLQLRWQPTTIEEEARVVQAVFGRADAWNDWANFPVDRPVASLWRVLVSIRGLFRPRDRAPTRPPVAKLARPLPAPPALALDAPTDAREEKRTRSRVGAGIGAAILLLAGLSGPAAAQPALGGTSISPFGTRAGAPPPPPAIRILPLQQPPVGTGILQPRPQPAPASVVPASVAPATVQPAPQPSGTLPVQPVPPPPSPGAAAAPAPAAFNPSTPVPLAADAPLSPGTRRVVFNLRQLGASGPLALRGTSELQGVEFGIRADEVVTAAQLDLTGAVSPALIPEFSNVTVTLNEQYIGTIPVNRDQPTFALAMPVSPVFFQDNNRLNFRFTGRYTPDCNDPMSGLLWSTIYDTSTLTLTLQRLPPQRDLARLPLPFFDPREKQQLSLPVILSANPSNDTLKTAGIVASWFGHQAAFRGAKFPVAADAPSEGNAVLVAIGNEGRNVPGLPAFNGPTLAMIANPNDSLSSILVIGGRTGDEAVAAATALVVGNRALGGEATGVTPAEVPERAAYDAPNWIPTNRPVKLGELVDAGDLQSYGYVGLLHVPFRTAPDFYTWRDLGFPMNVKFRGPPGPIIDVAPSRLDVGINGIYLDTFSLAPNDQRDSWLARLTSFGGRPDARVTVPTYDVFGFNDLQFYFDARPLHRGDCVAIPNDLRMSVDPDSTIDLSRGHRFAEMPNLAYFVNSGFPFTRMADLSQTAVVLPDRPSSVEVSAFLDMMGRFGDLTGYPVIRVAVVRPGEANTVAGRDLLLMGTVSRFAGIDDLLRNAPLRLSGNRLTVTIPSGLDSIRRIFGDRYSVDRSNAAATLSAGVTEDMSALVGSESPLGSGRSMVAILAAAPQSLEETVATFRDSAVAPLIQGDMAVLSAGRVTSYRVQAPYTVGTLPFWLYPSYLLRDQPFGIAALMLIGALLLGMALFWSMRRRAGTRLTHRRAAR